MRGLHPTFAAPVVAPFRQRRRPPASSGGRPIAACGPRLPPPSSYPALRAEAFAATGAALAAGVLLAEVQFPAVPNMATAALNEVLDANRAFAREFARGFVARGWRVNAVFGDVGEARLAVEAWGDDKRVGVRAIPRKGDSRPEGYLRGEGDGVCIVVSPGFNVAEWIDMERLEIEGGDPIVVVNGDLDKTRGGYYPRLFYPGLWKVRERFLSRFESVYYVKVGLVAIAVRLVERAGKETSLGIACFISKV